MIIGIVGHEAAKFTPLGEAAARRIIRELLAPPDAIVCSGHSPLGGVDIWAEEEADALGREKRIFAPVIQRWEGEKGKPGFRQRNESIARESAIVHCLVVTALPDGYKGMRFALCYHCKTDTHVKSGGCWTALRCKERRWHEIQNG